MRSDGYKGDRNDQLLLRTERASALSYSICSLDFIYCGTFELLDAGELVVLTVM